MSLPNLTSPVTTSSRQPLSSEVITTTTATTSSHPLILFTDLDGTLVHYPSQFSAYAKITNQDLSTNTATLTYTTGQQRQCRILTSRTGGNSYISFETIRLVEELRRLGVIVVVITGARSSTYMKRRKNLFECDYEFWENGGRMIANGKIVQDWSKRLVEWVGGIHSNWNLDVINLEEMEKRKGKLWQVCKLFKKNGWHVDAVDYATDFRVNIDKSIGKTLKDFESFVNYVLPNYGLTTSFNLGKADIYPKISGKVNAARHILQLRNIDPKNAVAMFDDDNDLELGALCGRSFLPGVTHPSVLKAVEKHPSWTLTNAQGPLGTEEALKNIIALRQEHLVKS